MNSFDEIIDMRIINALKTARDWADGKVTVGDARKASLGAIAAARDKPNAVIVAIARSAGHAVATAHMADHSLRAAAYAIKAIELSGESIEDERNWQNLQLPLEIRDLVLTARKKINQ
jgi:hypothetical protein